MHYNMLISVVDAKLFKKYGAIIIFYIVVKNLP